MEKTEHYKYWKLDPNATYSMMCTNVVINRRGYGIVISKKFFEDRKCQKK